MIQGKSGKDAASMKKKGGGDISTGGEETSLTLGHNQSNLHPFK